MPVVEWCLRRAWVAALDVERVDMKNEQERELTFTEKIRGLNENLFRLVEAYVDGVYAAMKVMESPLQ